MWSPKSQRKTGQAAASKHRELMGQVVSGVVTMAVEVVVLVAAVIPAVILIDALMRFLLGS